MPYQREVTFRGKLIPISKLSPNSDKKILITCPSCNTQAERYAKVLFKTCSFLCQPCRLKEVHEKRLIVGTKYNMLTITGRHSSGHSLVLCDCGNETKANNWNIESGKTKSCGCLFLGAINQPYTVSEGFVKGAGHPNWRGGISLERSRIMASKEYKEWRTAVFSRDSYKCAYCGVNSNTLEAHHILPFATYPDLRFTAGNGITLCKKHHTKFPKKYGRKEIGQYEIDEFISSKTCNMV